MKKIIYSKYSNDRSEDYKIRTDIVVDENGKRYARKSPLTEKCKTHINAMYENYLGLTEEFCDTNIRMNRCEKDGDALEFEYVEGKTYEVYLDELLEKDDAESFIDAVRKYVDVLKSAAVEDFVMTDAFRKMFGDTPNFAGAKCLKISDVDMIFPNALIHLPKWCISFGQKILKMCFHRFKCFTCFFIYAKHTKQITNFLQAHMPLSRFIVMKCTINNKINWDRD